MDFEKNLKQLEKMSEQMSSGQLGLKESIETFKKGIQLIEKCRKEISQAEQSVKKLIKINEDTGEIETEDFNPSSENQN